MLKESANIKSIIVDGIRNIEEVEILKSFGKVKVLAIHGSASPRFEHIKKRSREDAPIDFLAILMSEIPENWKLESARLLLWLTKLYQITKFVLTNSVREVVK